MKTTAFGLILSLGTAGCAQSAQAPAISSTPPLSSEGQPSADPRGAPNPTSSNPRGSLPAMSADRCAAEAIGTATDPNTGAPVTAAVDPQTGKPLCPPEPPNTTEPR
jgi:hypothetical protein